ncbi:MAG: fibronectin type III domain-containing protein, partial [Ferruginibacter sp.]|nr:fibronectin type III domain-containing protein [Cytophagales bacterium]
VRIVRQHITPTVDLAKRTAAVGVRVFLQNHASTARTVRGEVQLSAPNGYRKTLPFTATVPPNQRGDVVVNAKLTKQQVHLWHFDDPFLYTAQVRLTTTGQTASDRFGLRKIEVDNQNYAFKLNGESIRPMGFNLVPDDRTTGNTLPLWRIKEDIDKLKELGTNLARLSHLPLTTEALDYLDERGILTFAEVPLWGFDQLADQGQPLPKDWLERLITRDFNHPCVIGWSVGNEIGDYPGALAYVESAVGRVRQLDPSRLAVMVSHTAARNDRDPLQLSDVGLINSYGKGIGQTADKIHQQYPNKVLFYTEYGATQFAENLDGDLDAQALLDSMRGRPYLVGGSLWTFNDYRSNYFGTKEYSQNRPWGLVDAFRQPKRAYYRFRREAAPVRALAVTGASADRATVVLTPRGPLDLPAYTLTGYRLVWKVLDRDGRFVRGGFTNLPVIKPGDAVLQQPIQWSSAGASGNAQPGTVQIALVTPLNYAVYDTTLCFSKPPPPTVWSVMGGRTDQNGTRPKSGVIRVTFSPSPTATAHKVRYGVGELTNETPLTLNPYADVPELSFDTTYQVAVVAVNPAGESEPANGQSVRVERDVYPAPVVQYVEPADGAFFVGYATQLDDYLFQVRYTQKPGDYATAPIRQATTKGVMAVRGLTNGQPYYFQLRRMKDNNYPSAWSEERTVTPDGGQLPPAPRVQGIIRQGGEAELCFIPVPKATGYVVEYRPTATTDWSHIRVNTAQSGFFHLTGLDQNKPYQFRLATLNAAGQSAYSPLVSVGSGQ